MNKKVPQVLARSIFLLLSFAASSAMAEGESVAKNSTIKEIKTSTDGFHWLTKNCNVEEGDEIETTPGSPPLTIDDPATPGCNNWEINLVLDGDISKDEKNFDLPVLDLNYGIGDNLQVKFEIPNVVLNSQNPRTQAIGNPKTGLKYQFYGYDETKLQFAVYPQVEVSAANSLPENQGTIFSLPLLMARRIGEMSRGNVMMSANLAYNFSSKSDTADFVSALVGVGAPFINKTSILADIATEQAVTSLGTSPREQLLKFDIGIMSPVGKKFALFGSVGKSLLASDARDHTYLLTGFRVLVGAE